MEGKSLMLPHTRKSGVFLSLWGTQHCIMEGRGKSLMLPIAQVHMVFPFTLQHPVLHHERIGRESRALSILGSTGYSASLCSTHCIMKGRKESHMHSCIDKGGWGAPLRSSPEHSAKMPRVFPILWSTQSCIMERRGESHMLHHTVQGIPFHS